MASRGRPPELTEAREARLEIRLHISERVELAAASREAGLMLGEWVRTVALRVARETATKTEVSAPPDPPRWEYLVEPIASDPKVDDGVLDAAGASGWELVAMTPFPDRCVATFKRRIA